MDVKFQIIPHAQKIGSAFPTTVYVKNAKPGASIDVTLAQTIGGSFVATKVEVANSQGFAAASFSVLLTTLGTAYLSASASDSVNGAYDTTADSVEIVP